MTQRNAFASAEDEQSIPSRFEKIARLYPDRIAVKARNQTLTYDKLNEAANRMANAILAQRGQRQEPVALLLEYDVAVFAALLGVLKAGKFYVVLDPSYPRARIRSILEDTEAALIVTTNANLALAYELGDRKHQLLNIDECDSTSRTDNPGISISPDNLSYILYTSGSTDKSKGVIQSHRSELLRDVTHIERLHMCAEDRMMVIRSTVRVFPFPLLTGAAFFPWSVKQEGVAPLARRLIQEGITISIRFQASFANSPTP